MFSFKTTRITIRYLHNVCKLRVYLTCSWFLNTKHSGKFQQCEETVPADRHVLSRCVPVIFRALIKFGGLRKNRNSAKVAVTFDTSSDVILSHTAIVLFWKKLTLKFYLVLGVKKIPLKQVKKLFTLLGISKRTSSSPRRKRLFGEPISPPSASRFMAINVWNREEKAGLVSNP